MKIEKCIKRDRKRNKRIHGHRRDGDSVKTIQKLHKKRRDLKIKKLREEKETALNLGGKDE